MRLEANLPDVRASAVVQLADELGLSSSQLINEALSLFLKAVAEIKRGRRLVSMDPKSEHTNDELTTPTLTALECALNPQTLELPTSAIAKMWELSSELTEPGPKLKAAAKHSRQ